jgi:hypothetical protein
MVARRDIPPGARPVTIRRPFFLAATFLLALAGPVEARREPVAAALMRFEAAATSAAVSPE